MISKLSKLIFLVFILIGNRHCFSQNIPPLEPISKHYKTLAELSAFPNTNRYDLDTIVFPWTEYSTSSLISRARYMYLSSEDSARLPGLIRYPANSSDQTRAELDYLLQLQDTRTKEQIERSQFIATIAPGQLLVNSHDSIFTTNTKDLFFIASSVGSWFTPKNFPATTKLMMKCIQDIKLTEFTLKRHFKRSRPYHLGLKLNPLTKVLTPAFPSGHTLWAFGEAFVLGEIVPEHRSEFIAAAEEVRWSREIMGIHFPSDNEAARIIAWYLLKSWYHNPEFVRDMENAKKEWAMNKRMFK